MSVVAIAETPMPGQPVQGVPAYRQVADHFEALIRNGKLLPGDRLPTVRDVSHSSRLNKETVNQGYAELQRRGLVTSSRGKGTIVQAQQASTRPIIAERMQSLYRSLPPEAPLSPEPPEIDLAALWPEPAMFPLKAFRRILHTLLQGRPELMQYGSAQGYGPLRQQLDQRARKDGIKKGKAIVVQGSQQGLDLIFRTLLNPGDAVAVEAPTYASILPELAMHQARIVPIPVLDDGADRLALSEAIRVERVKLVYLMPNFQNPTGVTMSDRRRDEIARLAAATGVVVIEDDFEHDLRFTGRHIRPIAGRVEGATVIYLSSFSKTLLPGLRMGWMIAPEPLVEPLVLAKKYTDIYSSNLTQAALYEFCRDGQYERHVRSLRKVYRSRVEAALEALDSSMPRGARWSRPEGGFSIWVTLPDEIDADMLANDAAQHGLHFTPGSRFFPEGRDGRSSLRLSLSLASEPAIRKGVALLGRLAREQQAARRNADSGEPRHVLAM